MGLFSVATCPHHLPFLEASMMDLVCLRVSGSASTSRETASGGERKHKHIVEQSAGTYGKIAKKETNKMDPTG